jgi:hypothetical protein
MAERNNSLEASNVQPQVVSQVNEPAEIPVPEEPQPATVQPEKTQVVEIHQKEVEKE